MFRLDFEVMAAAWCRRDTTLHSVLSVDMRSEETRAAVMWWSAALLPLCKQTPPPTHQTQALQICDGRSEEFIKNLSTVFPQSLVSSCYRPLPRPWSALPRLGWRLRMIVESTTFSNCLITWAEIGLSLAILACPSKPWFLRNSWKNASYIDKYKYAEFSVCHTSFAGLCRAHILSPVHLQIFIQ